MSLIVKIPVPQSDFLDPRTNRISREWNEYLEKIGVNLNFVITDFASVVGPIGGFADSGAGDGSGDGWEMPSQRGPQGERGERGYTIRGEDGEDGGDRVMMIGGGEAEITAAQVEALGYWSPLTNGDPVTPELIFDSDGDTIAVWTPL